MFRPAYAKGLAPLLAAIAAAFVLVTAPVGGARAHAVVTGVFFESGEPLGGHTVQAAKEARLLLRFNAHIEPKFVTAALLTEGGSDRPLEVAASGKTGEVTVTLPPLPPGNYVFRYKVLAADGHLTEDIVRFAVAE